MNQKKKGNFFTNLFEAIFKKFLKNIFPIIGTTLSLVTAIVVLKRSDCNERFEIYFFTGLIYVTALLILLYIKDWRHQNSTTKVFALSDTLKQNEKKIEAIEKEKNMIESQLLYAENDRDLYKYQIDSPAYENGQRSLGFFKNYHEFSLLLDLIRETGIQLKNENLRYERQIRKLKKEYAEEDKEFIKLADDALQCRTDIRMKKLTCICERIIEYLDLSTPDTKRKLTVSFFICSNLDLKPITMKMCTVEKSNTVIKEARRTNGKSYPITENTDFRDICSKFAKGLKDTFYCKNNLAAEDGFRDSNHKYLAKKDQNFEYIKGEEEWCLPYKALISSAIYDNFARLDQMKEISGFLSVSSSDFECFKRSDTLLLQVLALQLHDICLTLKN